MPLQFSQHIPLAPYSTFRIGGSADYFYELKNLDELPEIFAWIKEKNLPYLVIGGGSNILFPDEGFCGLVIRITANRLIVEPPHINAEAGALMSQVVQAAFQHDLEGFEKWVGLPGTVGGALFGNAGVPGLEVKDVLTQAKIFDLTTQKFETVDNAFFDYSYRESALKRGKKAIICSATFALKPVKLSKAERQKIMTDILKNRHQKQPKGQNAGSFFKNPSPEKSAGYLIDQTGLKGFRVGDAQVSTLHGNFFMNLGNATQKEMLELARIVKEKVKEKFGIELHEEVRII